MTRVISNQNESGEREESGIISLVITLVVLASAVSLFFIYVLPAIKSSAATSASVNINAKLPPGNVPAKIQ